jgi:hypothetical protein
MKVPLKALLLILVLYLNKSTGIDDSVESWNVWIKALLLILTLYLNRSVGIEVNEEHP